MILFFEFFEFQPSFFYKIKFFENSKKMETKKISRQVSKIESIYVEIIFESILNIFPNTNSTYLETFE